MTETLQNVQDISLSDFNRIPSMYIGNAAETCGIYADTSYHISVEVDGKRVEVLLTSSFDVEEEPVRTENLNRYQKNPRTREKALGRVWKEVTAGRVMGLKINRSSPFDSGDRTAIVVRADSFMPPAAF